MEKRKIILIRDHSMLSNEVANFMKKNEIEHTELFGESEDNLPVIITDESLSFRGESGFNLFKSIYQPLVQEMEKPKSPLHVTISVHKELEDMYLIEFKTKTGEVKRKHIVIAKDLSQWTKSLEAEGWRDKPVSK
jgi:hypothetical protein